MTNEAQQQQLMVVDQQQATTSDDGNLVLNGEQYPVILNAIYSCPTNALSDKWSSGPAAAVGH